MCEYARQGERNGEISFEFGLKMKEEGQASWEERRWNGAGWARGNGELLCLLCVFETNPPIHEVLPRKHCTWRALSSLCVRPTAYLCALFSAFRLVLVTPSLPPSALVPNKPRFLVRICPRPHPRLIGSRQAKARTSTALSRLLDENALPGSLERTYPANAGLWPPAYAAAEGQSPSGDAASSSNSNSSGGVIEPRRVSRREPPTVLLVREGSVVATLENGTKTTVTAGAWCGCGG